MLSEQMQDALNGQANAELYSAYLYLSMSAYFQSVNLPGFARWMEVQAQEEVEHGMKLIGHVHERMGRVILAPIEGPPTEWESPLAAFEAAFAHEQKVTGLINDLVALARDEGDNAAEAFLQWFVTEQVEEEASADEIVQKLKLAGDAPGPLLMLDSVLGRRGSEQ
jgi:ferritin